MTITDLSIRHRLTVYVLIVFILVAGVGSYTSLPRESFPEVEIPLIVIYTGYLGASPEDVETLLTRPIETELKGITGIKEIRSTSNEGLSVIEVEFNPDVDLEAALQRVRERVDLAKAELPSDIDDDPRIQDVDFSQIPVLVVSLSGDVGLVQLKEIGERLKDDLEAIPGVNRVNVIGGREREVHVYVDPRRLGAFELSLGDVVTAVQRENLTVPGGEIDIGRLKYLVRVPAEIKDPRELEAFVVKVRDGVPVYVRDVATVVYGFQDETTRARLNERPSVTLTIEKRTGANIIDVADAVKQEVERRAATLPPSVSFTIVADQSKDIRSMVSELENNIVSGLLLVTAVLMAFLGLRNSIFVAVAIPLSMLLAFSVLQVMGFTLNMVVLFSLILVLGMLVDNAIVIVENIYRHREEGADGPTAASRATREVMVPVITSTVTTCCAFAPLLFWPGIVGDFMSFLPATLIVGLLASLAVALVFNPTLCAYFMKPPTVAGGGMSRAAGAERGARPPRATAEGGAGDDVPRTNEDAGGSRVMRAYERLLIWLLEPARDHGSRGWFLRNWLLMSLFGTLVAAGIGLALVAFSVPTMGATMLPLAGVAMALSGVAFVLQGVLWLLWSVMRRLGGWTPWVTDRRAGVIWSMGAILVVTMVAYGLWGRGLEFFPETEPRQVWVDLEVPSGTNLDTSDAIVRRIEELTRDVPDLRDLSASVGSSGVSLANPVATGAVGTLSRVTLDLLDHKDRSQNSLETLEQVRQRVAALTGGDITVDKPQEGPPTGKPVTIRVVGDDFRRLGELSRSMQETIRSVPGLVNLTDDFDPGKPEIRVRVNRLQGSVAGLNTREVARTIQTAIRGTEASKYRIGEDEYDIRVRLAPEARASLDALTNLTVTDEDGLQIPLRSIVDLETGVGPGSIKRIDLRRVVTIEGDVVRAPGRTEDSVRAAVAARLDGFQLPPGYRWEFAGANQEQDEAQAFLQRAFVMAVLLIVLVLVTQFNSLVMPITVMTSVVLSLIGVLWGLIVTGTPFGLVMTGVGVISLAGIVVNNAIVLGDFIQQLRARGVEKTRAVVRAGTLRFRPVLLTAATTILGLLPLTVGLNLDFFNVTVEYGAESSQWWGAMGVAVIAGLSVATVLTLVVVPVTYHTLDELVGLAARLPERFRAPVGEPLASPGVASRTAQ
jgi:multidrug efflux pump